MFYICTPVLFLSALTRIRINSLMTKWSSYLNLFVFGNPPFPPSIVTMFLVGDLNISQQPMRTLNVNKADNFTTTIWLHIPDRVIEFISLCTRCMWSLKTWSATFPSNVYDIEHQKQRRITPFQEFS